MTKVMAKEQTVFGLPVVAVYMHTHYACYFSPHEVTLAIEEERLSPQVLCP
ncbi:MAG: hypothetical protein ABI347_02180 [Nitrososphaera sp.]